jgi:parallel beta-helix repeat protein
LLANCGSDEVAPGVPTFSSDIPDIVFFNTAVSQPVVLFEGRATDNRWVDQVLISFDNGATWKTADINDDPPNTVRDVEWSYLATNADMPSPSTVLIRVIDRDANETTSSPIVIEKQTGSTIASFQALISSAAADDVIALSSGVGGAYGDGITAFSIPIGTAITVIGAGYGDTVTSGGVMPDVASTATILEAPLSSASIFSVQADVTFRGIRLVGAMSGISVADTPGGNPVLTVEDCLFDGQDAWALMARDSNSGDGSVTVQFLSSIVDASSAGSSTRGGLSLEEVSYEVSDSEFHLMTDPLGPDDSVVMGAAVQAVGGSGDLTESIFEDNALAIWASGGSPLITSCDVSGATATTSYGINLSGESDSVVIRGNTIDGNSGYGMRIGGRMTPKVRGNVISNNELSGILIDFSGPPLDVQKIDLGTTTDFGNNDLFDNTHPDAVPTTAQLFVTSNTTDPGVVQIPAEYNYWGVLSTIVETVIYHGVDVVGRARVDFNPAYDTPQN